VTDGQTDRQTDGYAYASRDNKVIDATDHLSPPDSFYSNYLNILYGCRDWQLSVAWITDDD